MILPNSPHYCPRECVYSQISICHNAVCLTPRTNNGNSDASCFADPTIAKALTRAEIYYNLTTNKIYVM